MKAKMYLQKVIVSGFTFNQRQSIAGYIDGPLCSMSRLDNKSFFVKEILHSTPNRYHKTADAIFIEGKNIKIEAVVDVLKRALTIAGASGYTLVRIFEQGSDGESGMVYNKRLQDM